MGDHDDRILRSLDGLVRRAFAEALGDELGTLAATLPPTVAVAGPRIGVVADTHCVASDGADLPSSVIDSFRDCDAIVHCGDLTSTSVLDRLAVVAPVLAVRSSGDPPADQRRLFDGRLLVRWSSSLIGVVADLPHGADPVDVFGTDVDLVCSGTSHVPSVTRSGATILVNPGSPTIPLSDAGPTVAVIDLADSSQPAVHLIHLTHAAPRRNP
jgi:putative phosphoesterase